MRQARIASRATSSVSVASEVASTSRTALTVKVMLVPVSPSGTGKTFRLSIRSRRPRGKPELRRRAPARRLERLLDLAGLQAPRADVAPARDPVHENAHALKVGIEASVRRNHRMAAVMAERRALSTHCADLGHRRRSIATGRLTGRQAPIRELACEKTNGHLEAGERSVPALVPVRPPPGLRPAFGCRRSGRRRTRECLSRPASCSPLAASAAMNSKCGVSPRITQPSASTQA